MNLRNELASRNDQCGYGFIILVFFAICYLIGDAYNFGIAGLIFLLLLAVLELTYRLSLR
ncbi:hypothetical protein LCGC14_2439940 [marine sediment metagenome]|uniref:Uncharacterized protein n=1 Tax=marine sediment metagenome TaxID=412755 RepID=A0A0F9ED90_9ZZZZ